MRRLKCLEGYIHMDAVQTAFLEKQLEYVESEAYEVLYSQLKAKEFIPFDDSLPSWAKTWTYRIWSKTGIAKLIANYADDLPRADVFVEEVELPTVSYGDSYGYSIADLEASARLETPLDTARAISAREVLDRQIDTYAATGESKKGIKGFLNAANVPTMTVTFGDWVDEIAAGNTEKVVADMFEIEQKVIDQSDEHHMPTDMILPPAYYNLVSSTPFGDNADHTILKYFLANCQSVTKVSRWSKCATAGAGGIPIIVCYEKKPTVVKFKLAYDFLQLEPEKRNLEWVVLCICKLGGTNWFRPLAGVFANGMHE